MLQALEMISPSEIAYMRERGLFEIVYLPGLKDELKISAIYIFS